MPMVNIRDNDSFDVALRRFKRSCEKAGILSKLRQIEYHEKDTTKRKRKKAAACKREMKRLKKEGELLERNKARRFNFDTAVTTAAKAADEPAPASEQVTSEAANSSAEPKADETTQE